MRQPPRLCERERLSDLLQAEAPPELADGQVDIVGVRRDLGAPGAQREASVPEQGGRQQGVAVNVSESGSGGTS